MDMCTSRREFLTAITVPATVGAIQPTIASTEAESVTENWSGYRGGPKQSGAAGVDGIRSVETTRWTAGDEDNHATMPAVVDGTAYLGVGSQLVAVDVQSGTGKWVASVPATVSITPCVGTNLVIATTDGGDVIAVDRETGEQQWSIGTGGATGSPTISDGTVYVGNSNGRVLALKAQSGEVQWSTRHDEVSVHEDWSIERPAPAVSGDSIYVNLTAQTGGGKLVSLNRATGEEQWSHKFDHDRVFPPAISGDLLAVASEYGELKLFSKTGGLVKWEKDFDDSIESPPAFDGETVSIVLEPTVGKNRCLAFDASSGDRRWEYLFDDATTAGGVGFAQGMVYATTYTGGRSGIVVGLDYDSGLEQFTYEIGSPFQKTPTPVKDGLCIPNGTQVRCLGNSTVETTPTETEASSSTNTDRTTMSETETPSSTESTRSNGQDETRTVSSAESDDSRSFFGEGGSTGGSTLTVVSTVVTVIGTFVGLMQLLKGD